MAAIKIITSSHYLPKRQVSNDDLSHLMDTSDEWIKTRTGIEHRRISEGENTSDLCTAVAVELLKKSGWSPESIDLIIVATMSPDYYTPATAAIVQGKIKAKQAVAFDLSAACSGFIYSLVVAQSFMGNMNYRRVMIIGGEVLSKVINWHDRTSAVLFGDGAAGVLLENEQDSTSSFLGNHLQTFGDLAASLQAGKTLPLASFPANSPHNYGAFEMAGRDVYTFATHRVPESIIAAVKKSNLQLNQVDWFIVHQANSRIIKQIAKRLQQPLEKFPMNIAAYGNTSAASVPILLDELIDKKKIERGQILVLTGFGGGLTVGTQIIKY